jgi:phosphate transport system substrate-binding protein
MKGPLAIPLFLLVGCTSAPPDPRTDDRPTFGEIDLLADADFRDLVEEERKVFEAIYTDTRLNIRYLPERDLAAAMMSDSVRMVFAAFAPGDDQHAFLRPRQLVPRLEPVATDGIALLAAPECPIDSLSLDQLVALLEGRAEGPLATVMALFDGPGSGVARTLVDSLLGGDPTRLKNASAARDPDDLLHRVVSDPNAIGFLSFALFSDADDTTHRTRRAKVELVAVSDTAAAVLPSQSSLADRRYPLRRKVGMIMTEGKSGLGTGFASFVAGPKGQRIILKQGLVPERIPAREIKIVQP